MKHRATLSLQVAAEAHLRGLNPLRNHMVAPFTNRARSGTLHDPAGQEKKVPEEATLGVSQAPVFAMKFTPNMRDLSC